MTFEEFKKKFNFKKASNSSDNCTQCDRFGRFQVCKPIMTGICYHYHLGEQEPTSCLVDQEHICDRYLPRYGTRPLTVDEKKLKKLEKKERDEIEEKNKKLAKALSIDFKDDQLTEEERVGLMAEIARDEYGDAAFIEDELSRTELKAVISGDDKLEKLVENEKRLREMIREMMQ